MVAEGKQLFGPSIRYENVTVEPRQDGIIDWKTGNRFVRRRCLIWFCSERYTKPARVSKAALLVFDKCMNEGQAQRFIESFFRVLESRGLRMCNPRDIEMEFPFSERTEEVHNAIATYAKKKYTIVLALTREKLDPVHSLLVLLFEC